MTGRMFLTLDKLNDTILGVATQSLLDKHDKENKDRRTPIKSGVDLPHITVWIDNKEPYDWCCPDCQELVCECQPRRPISEDHPHYKKEQTLFCPNCEFVRIMSDDGKGYCQVHGDINGGPSDD